MTAYDQVLYPSYTHPQTHPDRLATIGTLFQMRPPPPSRCRVLELGCGNGSNLVPLAWSLPDSEFVGIDLAARPIAHGQRMIEELKLNNVRLVQKDLMELQPGGQPFDYIIAHGLFSWVPAPVRTHLLSLCRGCLSPEGIAFVSYNAYPGCHLRNMVREMMLFHLQGVPTPEEKCRQAVAFLSFLANGQETPDEYRQWMKLELERVREHQEGHLFHDELAELSQPFYFTQFMGEAGRHGLQYLGEADFFEMSDHVFAESVRTTLQQLSGNRLLREQYLDFLKCRRFRQTLLTHREVSLPDKPHLEVVDQLSIASLLTCPEGPVDLRPGVTACFEAPRGAKAQTDFALGKAALLVLSEAGLPGLPFEQLLDRATQRLQQTGITLEPGDSPRASLRGFLMQLYSSGVVDFRLTTPACARTVGQRPRASPVVQWQVQNGNFVTSLFHVAVQIEDEMGRQLLLALDGTRDRAALIDALRQFLEREKKGVSPDRGELQEAIGAELDRNLAKLVRMGLLVA